MPLGLPTFSEALRAGAETFHALRALLKKRGLATGVGDEGGFAPSLQSNREAVELVLEAVHAAGYQAGRDMFVALDVASSEFWDDAPKHYVLKKSGEGTKSSDEMIALYEDWTRQYPIISIEDGLAEGDWPGWKRLTRRARLAHPARRRRRVRDEPGDPARRASSRTSATRCSSSSTRSAPSRETLDAVEMARAGGLRERDLASLGRDRRHDDRRPRGRDLRRSDQDRLGQPLGSHRQIQPVAAHRGGARTGRDVRRARGHPAGVMKTAHRVVLLRHGESTWNKENRFTGWTDVDLSDKGRDEARRGRPAAARSEGFTFDSPTRRCSSARSARAGSRSTSWICSGFPMERDWRLNERHYGALQGLNKAETAAKHGEAQTKIWRRSYDIPPPPLDAERPAAPVARSALRAARAGTSCPATESLKDTVARFLPYWNGHDRAGDSRGPARAHHRARQQPARAREVPRPHLRSATSSSSTSRRGFRWCTSWTRRMAPVTALLPRRSRRRAARGGGGGESDEDLGGHFRGRTRQEMTPERPTRLLSPALRPPRCAAT